MKKVLVLFAGMFVFSVFLFLFKVSAQVAPGSYPASYPVSDPISAPAESQDVQPQEQPQAEKIEVTQLSPEYLDAKNKVEDDLQHDHDSNTFFVVFKTDTDNSSAASIADEPLQNVGSFNDAPNVKFIKVDSASDLEKQMIKYQMNPNVDMVQENRKYKVDWTTVGNQTKPNDFSDSNHWYYLKDKLPEVFKEQGCGTVNNALCGGSSSVVVAVLDTGLAFENYSATYRQYDPANPPNNYTDYSLAFHKAPELTGVNIWTNPNEDNSGTDNDGDGFCDDLHGVDMIAYSDNFFFNDTSATQRNTDCINSVPWVQKEGHPDDDYGHGTYVSMIIASAIDNATSSLGIANSVTIMPVKVVDYSGTATTFTIWKGIRYAVDKGAKVINMSLAASDDSFDSLTTDAIQYAQTNHVLVVIASGNSGNQAPPNDTVRAPAIYTKAYNNVVAVGAYNSDDTRSFYTSDGPYLDLVAPVGSGSNAGNAAWQETLTGFNPNTTPEGSRDFSIFGDTYAIGTSFAAPQVTAAAALVYSKNPTLDPGVVKNYLQTTARDIGAPGRDDLTGYGALDLQELWLDTWSSWNNNGASAGNIIQATFNNKIIQSTVSPSGVIWTRNSSDGINWSSWLLNGGSNGKIYFNVFNNNLIETTIDSSGLVWVRYTTDGVNWQPWVFSNGYTTGFIFDATLTSPSRLFQATAVNGDVWTRYTSDGINWQSWVKSGVSDGRIFMKEFNGKIVQTTVYNNQVWTRATTDASASTWLLNGGSSSDVFQIIFNGKLVESVVANGQVWTRYTTDAVNWQPWVLSGGSDGLVFSTTFSSKLIQSVVANGQVWTRYTTDAVSWQPWVLSGGSSGRLFFDIVAGRVIQTVIANGIIWFRSSADGITWNTWAANGGTSGLIYSYNFDNMLYQATTSDGQVWVRHTSDGINWGHWISGGNSIFGIFMTSLNNRIVQTVVDQTNTLNIRYDTEY